jgi:hypothetical protein
MQDKKTFGTRLCTGCHRDLPLDRFGLDRSKPSGRHSRCVECKRAQKRANSRRAAPLDRTVSAAGGTVPIDAQIRRYALAELVRRHRDELNDIYVMERYRRRLPTGKGEAAWLPASEIS